MDDILSAEELELTVGDSIKALRLQKNLARDSLAAQAGVSMSALRHLESGQGSNLTTLIRAVRALGRQDWLLSLAPRITINPLHMVQSHAARQRARRKKKEYGEQK